jgi:hypothetical protein
LPGWNGFLTVPNTHDLGLVTLDEAMPGPYGVLAPAGTLDPLATRRGLQDMSIEVVGYGLQGVKPVASAIRERLKATTQMVSLGSAYTDGFNGRASLLAGSDRGGQLVRAQPELQGVRVRVPHRHRSVARIHQLLPGLVNE